MSVVNKAPKANRAPVLNPMEAITLESGETYALHARAADPDGDALTYARAYQQICTPPELTPRT